MLKTEADKQKKVNKYNFVTKSKLRERGKI